MPRYITLKLVNEQGTPLPWPGTDALHEIGSELAATPVWIGVSADGADNQVYPITADPATILQSWPHLYQGVQLNLVAPGDDSPLEPGPGEYVYYNSLEEFNRLVAACCIAQQVDESPQESPGPISQAIQMSYGFNQFLACEAEPETFYVAADADLDNLEGEAIYTDPELTTEAFPGANTLVVNGNIYLYNNDNLFGELVNTCEGLAEILFTFDFDDPGQEGEFRLVSNETMQFFVDWGDGSGWEEFNGADVIPTHVYTNPGQYPTKVRFGTITVPFHTLEMVNKPLAAFGFHPDYGNAMGIQTLQIENAGLTDGAVDWASFVQGNINTIIMAGNQLTAASIPQMPAFTLVVNLNNNPIGPVAQSLFSATFNSLAVLILNNAGVTSYATTGAPPQLNTLELANNGLETLDPAGLDMFNLTTVNVSGNSLTSGNVDDILIALDNGALENGLVNLAGQTPAAPPGIDGETAKTNLEGKFWTVTVDS